MAKRPNFFSWENFIVYGIIFSYVAWFIYYVLYPWYILQMTDPWFKDATVIKFLKQRYF